jgi:predicted flap endonuclease-1-like 5' DNA nuclease
MNWLSFFIGVIVGGVIVYFFWRRKAQEAREIERALRQRLADAESETRRLTSQLDGLKQQKEQFATCKTELQMKTEKLQQVTEQLSAAEGQIRTMSETRHLTSQLDSLKQQEAQFATCKTELQMKTEKLQQVTEQLSAAEGQIRTLRAQLAAVETKAEAATDRSTPQAAQEVAVSVQPDDLTKIEGIGPKVAQVLNESGILTFAQLAQTDVNRLQAILQEAGPRFKMIVPESWPEQAGLAAKGDWDVLQKLQDELDGGKYRR